MPNQADPNIGTTEKSSSLEETHTTATGKEDKLDRSADQAANKAAKTEKDYDRDHNIFTK